MRARRAATAGGIASGLWFLGVRSGLPPLCPRALTVCVEVAVPVRVGVRGGITTGFECMGAAGGGAPLASGLRIGSSIFCTGLTRILFEVDGAVLADRAPIFSEVRGGDGAD